ncbi:MAG: helix-turn-helix transcriptional regulator [Spirochaetales bacterium]|nr:helix-turn-helix transcriptional regulator [Spirochaetales bacterium]
MKKKQLERLLMQILQILGLTSETITDFHIDIRSTPNNEKKIESELLIRLPVHNTEVQQIFSKFKINPEQRRKNKKQERERYDLEFSRKLHSVIKKNFSNSNFNVEQLAGMLYMSKATLYRRVKKVTGISPVDFLCSFRLAQAVLLLEKKIGSIIDVAIEVGFNNRGYFTKCFKEKFHITPSQFLAGEAGVPEQANGLSKCE